MNRFRDLLREIFVKLDLPQPEKSRILIEIASDLEDAYRYYLERGHADEEAARMAMERFSLSDEALAELAKIHQSTFRRFLGRLSEQAQSRWERLLLAVIVIVVAGLAARTTLTADIYRHAGAFVWPELGAAVVAFAIFVVEAYRLCLKKSYDAARLREGPGMILALGGLALLAGLGGSLAEFHRAAGAVASDSNLLLPSLVEWGIRTSAVMTIGILSAMAAGLAWFLLMGRVREIEAAEAAALIE